MRPALAVLAVGGGTLVQSTVSPHLALGGVVPDVPVVLVVLMALSRGPEAGCLTGFLLGLAQDGLAGGPLGVHALSRALLGFAIGELPRLFLVRRPMAAVALAGLASLADSLLRFAILQAFHYPAPFGELFTRVMLPQAGLNVLLAVGLVAVPALRPRVRLTVPGGA